MAGEGQRIPDIDLMRALGTLEQVIVMMGQHVDTVLVRWGGQFLSKDDRELLTHWSELLDEWRSISRDFECYYTPEASPKEEACDGQ